jgi:hypothetical protein
MCGWAGGYPISDVTIITPTMITSAAPRAAIAISPGEYFVFFCAGADRGWLAAFFFFFRGFFDMTPILYRATRNRRGDPDVETVDDENTRSSFVGLGAENSAFRIPKSYKEEEPPRSSLNSGGSLEKVGIMVGLKGRQKPAGGGRTARTRWACRRPSKLSGLPRSETSRDKGPITTWRSIHTQYPCPVSGTNGTAVRVFVARSRVSMSLFGN